MYFVVYVLSTKIFVVIPENWIFEYEPQKEKFLNSGLNGNQKHIFFWTTNSVSRLSSGAIRLDFQPNFSHPLNFDNIFPAEGCYLCYIVRAKGSFVLCLVLFFSSNHFLCMKVEFSFGRMLLSEFIHCSDGRPKHV